MIKLFIIFLMLIALELLYFKVALKYGIIDKPNIRSSHKHITLRGGGVIFYFGALLFTAFYGCQYAWFLLGLTFVAAISFVDDIHSLPNRYRVTTHLIAILLMIYQWGVFCGYDWWVIVLLLIVCTGVINAFNFMDGINGMTGGYAIAIIIPLIILNRQISFINENFLIVSLMSLLIFCFFNYRGKAKCFAGDVGSFSIAFIVLFALGSLMFKTGEFYYIIFLLLYGVDSVLTITHRLMLHENIFKAHRKHLYQIMANELHIPHVVVSTVYFALQIVISLGVIFIKVNGWVYFMIVAIALVLIYVIFMKKYFHLHMEYLQQH
jgi:UDP-N-acetylmuramyl pentapeptide phosphotransferase/UDP-N-acetylglucosamine-1-phosphate transferase